ncbi:MAG: ribonuclease VapC [Alphaproteobacteria bacterium]|nr:MAG: ribonuclease VapC [Alphaproteobacteria bacterium]
MSVVVDCSVAIAWYLPDETSVAAGRVLEYVIERGGVVPFLFRLEFANSLLMAERRKRIPRGFPGRAFAELDDLQVVHDLEGHENVWSTCVELADKHRLTAFDAAYLELAQRSRLPLATLDKALRRAAEQAGVEPFSTFR